MRILHRTSAKASNEHLDFAEFVRDVSPRLLRTAYLLSTSQDTAEDLVQEALERACRRWHRIAAMDTPEAYVRRIIVNLANDRWRQWGRLRETSQAQPPDRVDPHDDYARLDLRDQLTALLEKLPVRTRTVIVLRYLHDLDDQQIADALGISPGTVRSQLSRGLTKLRGTLAVDDDGAKADEPATRPRPQAPDVLPSRSTADLPHGGIR